MIELWVEDSIMANVTVTSSTRELDQKRCLPHWMSLNTNFASDTLNFPNEGEFVTGGSDTSWVYTCEGMCLIELGVEDSITANLIVLPLRLKSLI